MQHTDTAEALDVIVIGAGQAGLAAAYHLKQRGVRFLVVDAASEIGHAWRSRWDSLRLFTAAQYDALPGLAFPAPDDTYPTKDQAADYLVEYAHRFDLPVLLNCAVHRLVRLRGGFAVHTSQGRLLARQVVVATGPLQKPIVPAVSGHVGEAVAQLHTSDYRNPTDIPPGQVVVVGAGNSGRQIVLELAATHDVTLAVGTESLQLPQRILGRDLFWWLTRLGVVTSTDQSSLARRMRARGDLVIGTPMRDLRRAGVSIRPRVTSAGPEGVEFGDGSRSRPSTVIWATGFSRDYSWIDVPGVVDRGTVLHHRGITEVPGLSFIGLPWQHTRGSSLLGFVQHDAAWLIDRITRSTARKPDQPIQKEYVR
jgi:putative flavoprotein involved in K+ transport